MNLGTISVAAPNAASSSTARYSSIARLAASGGQSPLTSNAILPIGIGPDQAGIDRKTFSANQSLIDAAAQDGLKQPSQQIALPEATMAVLRESRVVGNIAIKPEAAKPAICQVQVDFFAEPDMTCTVRFSRE
jgi:hypothetical protein